MDACIRTDFDDRHPIQFGLQIQRGSLDGYYLERVYVSRDSAERARERAQAQFYHARVVRLHHGL